MLLFSRSHELGIQQTGTHKHVPAATASGSCCATGDGKSHERWRRCVFLVALSLTSFFSPTLHFAATFAAFRLSLSSALLRSFFPCKKRLVRRSSLDERTWGQWERSYRKKKEMSERREVRIGCDCPCRNAEGNDARTESEDHGSARGGLATGGSSLLIAAAIKISAGKSVPGIRRAAAVLCRLTSTFFPFF